MIKNLYVFDHDSTLMDVPEKTEENKQKWSDYYGKPYPYIGWWSKFESLDTDVFDIKPIESVYKEYLKAKQDDDGMVVLLTSRLPKFKEVFLEILGKFNITFDKYLFKSFNKEKSERIDELLEKYPTIEYIEIWDDRQVEIDLYNEWAITKSPDIYIKINHV